MKAGRRTDVEALRRDARDRDISPVGRIRKRPSMLSEFHGKHYNHREADRDGRYGNIYDQPIVGTAKYDRYGQCIRKAEPDSRRHPYIHHYPSPRSSTYYHYQPHHHNEISPNEDWFPAKRPRLYIDVNRRTSSSSTFDAPSSADSSISSPIRGNLISSALHAMGSSATSGISPQTTTTGLSAYLEDIDSEDEALLREEEEEGGRKSPVGPPTMVKVLSSGVGGGGGSHGKPTKEELLQMMERVDRDIAATEGQIAVLQKKQAELEETSKASLAMSTSSSSVPPTPSSFQLSPKTPTPPLPPSEEGSPIPSPKEERRPSPKRSLAETIYAENRMKARAAHLALASLVIPQTLPQSATPLYFQPSESPGYHNIIERHRAFRPKLIEYVRKQKLAKHKQELKLCEQYDSLMADWDRRLEKVESSSKRKARDAKNRELFERVFPELKTKREQQERFTRVDQRGIGVVRSDAELKELMYELYEQEEAPVRYRRTHASIPSMLIHQKELEIRFHSTNGLISDPMTTYRESKLANVWSDEEKRIFREKFMMFPKNFEMIASFLPNKTTADCVKHYYLSKKNDNLKQLVRKANFKRRKFIKPQELSPSPAMLLNSPPPALPTSLPMDVKPKPELLPVGSNEGAEPPTTTGEQPEKDVVAEEGSELTVPAPYKDWTVVEIDSLKEGLRKYGRAWAKIYREVGGRKTATQCKQFYDDLCTVEDMGLQQALADHTSMKNAERAIRKAKSRKPVPATIVESKKKVRKPKPQPSTPMEEDDSENTESASETESASGEGEESESESTITDSSPEEAPASQQPQRVQRGKKIALNTSSMVFAPRKTSEDALDLFISAAEALNNIVPPEIALHDHSYSLPPRSLMSGVDLQGSSGLSLIAAAAAVVSPSLSRSAGSGKLPGLSPVRAPRGRPPNSQRRGGGSSVSKLSPTLLSPAGSSSYVPLTDIKPVTFRGRTRSAPADRPRSATITVPRTASNLSRISLSSSGVSKVRSVLPPSLHSRQRDSSPSTSSLSLKSMIASQPQQANSSTTGGSAAAFEALVNVAVAAPPAELHAPRSSSPATSRAGTGPPTTLTFQRHNSRGGKAGNSGSRSTPATPLNTPSHHHHVQAKAQAKDGNAASSTPILDAINILALASLAQAPHSTSSSSSSTAPVLSAQPLLVQAPALQTSNLLGTIMTQNSNVTSLSQQCSHPSNTNSITCSGSRDGGSTSTSSSVAVSSNVTASVNSLLEHLTSSVGINTRNGAVGVVSKASTTASKSAVSTEGRPRLSQIVPNTSKGDEVLRTVQLQKSSLKDVAPSVSSLAPHGSSGDDLSNLNLLSTLVAVLTPSSSPQPKAPPPFTATAVTTAAKASSSVSSTVAATFKSISPHHHSSVPSVSGAENLSTSKGKVFHEARTVSETGKPSMSSGSLRKSSGVDLFLPSRMRGGMNAQDTESPEHEVDNLPRSVVRTNPQAHQLPNAANDITSSLGAAPPSTLSYPSMSQQSTVLLYTRSLSFPLATSKEPSPDEEDHLESVSRGISELSKLLGTDSSTESLNTAGGSSTSRENSVDFKATWKGAELSNSSGVGFTGSRVTSSSSNVSKLLHSHGHGQGGGGVVSSKALNPVFSTRTEITSEGTKPYLSSLLESHGTVHKAATVGTPTAAKSGNTNSSNSHDISLVDLERHSR